MQICLFDLLQTTANNPVNTQFAGFFVDIQLVKPVQTTFAFCETYEKNKKSQKNEKSEKVLAL